MFHILSVMSEDDWLSAIMVRRSTFLAVERQYCHEIPVQRTGEERTQDCWFDIATGEIERTTTFREISP